MRKLHYWWLCPYSRKVRILLGELKLPFDLKILNPWELDQRFLDFNPAGSLPVFEDNHGIIVTDSQAIGEYLDETHQAHFMGRDPIKRAEIRGLIAWWDQKFYNDVWYTIVFEKGLKSKFNLGAPDAQVIREGNNYLVQHLQYLTKRLEQRPWVAGEDYTLADITAAAHLSCVDYFGHITWSQFPVVTEWYVRLKSRPSFRPLLQDRLPALAPSAHYSRLDF